MARYMSLYLACAVVFFVIDFIWLSLAGPTLYKREIGNLLLEQPNLLVAAGFYLFYVVGIVLLVAGPANGDVMKALLMGAVLGFVAYGTYDLTNLSTMRGFTPTIAIIDMAWGTFLTAASAAAGVFIVNRFLPA
jgi:uncharacterized membrane protein